jgi:hypothetical protein
VGELEEEERRVDEKSEQDVKCDVIKEMRSPKKSRGQKAHPRSLTSADTHVT